jgi:hypothetical protein
MTGLKNVPARLKLITIQSNLHNQMSSAKHSKTKAHSTPPHKKGGVDRNSQTIEELRALANKLKTVNSQSSTDAKAKTDTDLPIATVKDMLRSSGFGKKPLKVWLWFAATQTSSANTVLTFSQRLRPSDSAEFTSLAALYDEYKGLESHVIYHAAVSGAAATTNIDFAAAYDPTNSGAYGSIVAILPARHHVYNNITYDTSIVGGGAPKALTPNGHWAHRFRFPSGNIVDPTVANSVNTGNWTDTSETAVDYGFWKAYVSAAGTSSVVNIGLKIGILTEFKMRS